MKGVVVLKQLDSTLERRRIIVQGIVQGVGFRPFVYSVAAARLQRG
jgi:acylphosphatase